MLPHTVTAASDLADKCLSDSSSPALFPTATPRLIPPIAMAGSATAAAPSAVDTAAIISVAREIRTALYVTAAAITIVACALARNR